MLIIGLLKRVFHVLMFDNIFLNQNYYKKYNQISNVITLEIFLSNSN